MTKLKETGPAKELRKRINWLEDQLHSLKIMNGVGYTARRLATGTTLQIKIPKVEGVPSDLKIQKFKITAIGQVTLTCRKLLDDDTEASEIDHTVFRPIKTRPDEAFPESYIAASEFDIEEQSRTFSITLTSGAITKNLFVTQEIYPLYKVNDIIFAASSIDGNVYDEESYESDWIDLNVDARHWKYTEKLIEGCVNNQIQYMMVLGSASSA